MTVASMLDDRGFVTRNDPKGMLRLTEAFPEQVRQAVDAARSASLPASRANPDMVVLLGMGGSAAGGDFVRALFESDGQVPFQVVRDYGLPSYVKAGTLVFASSYSGQTEETLAAYSDAKRRGCPAILVTSGGKLAEAARADGDPIISIPAGQPPRTALGFLLIPVVVACETLGLLPKQDYGRLIAHLETCVRAWGVDQPYESNPTKQLAEKLHGAFGVIYGLGTWPSLVGNRWKGQINENAKNMILCSAFPELNHNEILGWVQADAQGIERWQGILLQDGTESAKMKKRFEVTSRLIEGVCPFEVVTATGETLLEKMVSLALYGDFVSLYLAALNDVDPENIDSINILKSELAQIP